MPSTLMLSFYVLLLAATFGGVLTALHLRTETAPPRQIFGVLHGLIGLVGLFVLLRALRGPPRGATLGIGSFGEIAAVLLVIALLPGLGMLVAHLRHRRMPGFVIGVHATAAISGVVILAAYALVG